MPLVSNLFHGNARLNACLTSDPSHVTSGQTGEHVRLIQIALGHLDQAVIDPGELAAHRYGPSTAAAALAYKQKRNIINRAYQTSADNIVGRMTMAALDKEMAQGQVTPGPTENKRCPRVANATFVATRPVRQFVG
jgi:hypothetical protein